MNKIYLAAAVLPALLLIGCGKEKDPEEYVRAENFTVHTSAVLSETQMQEFNTETTVAPKIQMSYALNGTSVELYVGGIINMVLPYYYTPDSTAIIVADFNFDGYNDIYIPYESPTSYGYYYCYDPTKNTFKENDALAEIGRMMNVTGDGILTEELDDGYTKSVIDYKWTSGKVKPFRRTETYRSFADNKMHTDVYVYNPNGTEYLSDSFIEEEDPTEAVTQEETLPEE